MSAQPAVASLAEQIIIACPGAEWQYNLDIGGMHVVQSGDRGRHTQAPWIDIIDEWDTFARLDAETAAPLSSVTHPFGSWLRRKHPLIANSR